MSGTQIEFGLSVAVCAWCKRPVSSAGLEVVSHGICPRHFRQLCGQAVPRAPSSRRSNRGRLAGRDLGMLLPL